MKIFSVSQIRKADEFTIANEPIPSINLMERAARACYDWFHKNISRQKNIIVFCGNGNNGGDGLALARMLKLGGYCVRIVILNHSQNKSNDFVLNLERLKTLNISTESCNSVHEIEFNNEDVLVDAILGSGLTKPLHGFLAEVVKKLNQIEAIKIAIDIPTGLFADDNSANEIQNVFKADQTLTFQFPKWSFLFPEYGALAGEFEVLDIGLSPDYISRTSTQNYFIDEDFVRPLLKRRTKFDHKGTFGHALLIAGSEGKIGAAILASKAALKTGAGLVTAYMPKCGLLPIQIANPEIMVLQDAGTLELENLSIEKKYNAIGIGPGIGSAASTSKTLLDFIKIATQPLVLDADALNILAAENSWDHIPPESVLTPHLGELDRMLGERLRGESVYDEAQKFAKKHKVCLVVKGAHTAIYGPDGNVYFNSTGCNGMATAGSGDVLTGMITGLLAQGLDPLHAAIVGVYFHGKAGETAAIKTGNSGLLASDIITNIRID